MKIQILNFIKDQRPPKEGYFDVKITYSEEKWEIFRNVTFFRKDDGKKWISFGNIKRNEKWIPRYEREPALSIIVKPILDAIEEFFANF